jgi:FkbM family methyltransferase
MSLRDWTPFRQLYNGYAALHDTRASVAGLAAAQAALRAELQAANAAQAAANERVQHEMQAANAAQAAANERVQHELQRLRQALPVAAHAPVDLHEALGFRLLLDETSLVDRAVIETGEWERPQLAFLAELIERMRGRGDTLFMDVGAYWGLYSLVAHRSGAFDRLLAFEADPHNFAQLQANLFLNGAAKAVQCVATAVSDVAGTLVFRDSASHPDGNRAGTGVLHAGSELPGREVACQPLDALVPPGVRHILLKIDVEGHEANVLRGMAGLVARHRIVAQVEIFDLHQAAALAEIERLGLREIHRIYPDYYFTNIPADELGL